MLQFFNHCADIARFLRFSTRFIVAVFAIFALSLQARAADVAVTLPPLAGLVSVLDPSVTSLCLLKRGADPHHFQLSPHNLEALQQSRLLVRSSMDDGGWPLPPSHDNTLDLWPQTSHGWLSPKQVKAILPTLSMALIRLNPDHEASIRENLAISLRRTDLLARKWKKVLQGTPAVIMQHPSWLPMMQELDIPVLAILESEKHGHETGPHHLEEALAALNKHPATLLLADLAHSPRPLNWLARHAIKPPRQITLDPLGSCGEPWDRLMQQNLERFRP